MHTARGIEVREGTPPSPEFIVAEVSKTWPDPEAQAPADFLCGKFELVINRNAARGYVLHSFALNRVTAAPAGKMEMNETIIAVFRRAGNATEEADYG